MKTLEECLELICKACPDRIIISKAAAKQEKYKKITVDKKASGYQISCFTEKQAFHENIKAEELGRRCAELALGHFRQLNAFSAAGEHIVLISKNGSCSYKLNAAASCAPAQSAAHDRTKNYILKEGEPIAPLIDMGIFTAEGKVVSSMYDKFRQINRFLEILDDEISTLKPESLNIIDFGCGKSYLTFLIYYYLVEIKGIKANIVGLDLKEDVIIKCGKAAEKYGYSGLHFELGDINGYKAPFDVDMVVTLHACDTATDYALYNAVQWHAKMIFSVPCCQHELNAQFKAEELGILGRYGIIKERFSALATDAIRADTLEYSGYKTQLLEFIDFAHTPKNLLIRAVRKPVRPGYEKEKYRKEISALCRQFDFEPTICRLLDINTEQ